LFPAWFVGALVFAMASSALANPFFIGRFDGLAGGPLNKDSFAAYWNPAAMARTGSRIQLHGVAVYRKGTFDRFIEENGIPPELAAANGGKNKTERIGVVPALAGSTGLDFGPWTLGIGGGAFIDRAGTMLWDSTPNAAPEFPGARDGSQRWAGIATHFVIFSPGLGLALAHRDAGLSIGATVFMNSVNLSTVRARNADRSDRLVDARGRLSEGRILFKDGKDIRPTVAVGARWEVAKDFIMAAAWHGGTTYKLDGEVLITFGLAEETRAPAKLAFPVADMFRLGLEFGISPRVRVRSEVELGKWSVVQRQKAINTDNGENILDIPRFFRDTLKKRFVVEWQANPNLTLFSMAAYETGTTPMRTHEPGLAEADNMELGLGTAWSISKTWVFKSALTWQEFAERTVSGSIQSPPQNGHYTDRRIYLTADVEARW
jgi:long-chain fatty acid transport protein